MGSDFLVGDIRILPELNIWGKAAVLVALLKAFLRCQARQQEEVVKKPSKKRSTGAISDTEKVPYRKRFPWITSLYGARQRCSNPKVQGYRFYGARGIVCYLTAQDVKALWDRDSAGTMGRPSIDRVDSNGHYTLKNCRFIELGQNAARANRKYEGCSLCHRKHLTGGYCAYHFNRLKRKPVPVTPEKRIKSREYARLWRAGLSPERWEQLRLYKNAWRNKKRAAMKSERRGKR